VLADSIEVRSGFNAAVLTTESNLNTDLQTSAGLRRYGATCRIGAPATSSHRRDPEEGVRRASSL